MLALFVAALEHVLSGWYFHNWNTLSAFHHIGEVSIIGCMVNHTSLEVRRLLNDGTALSTANSTFIIGDSLQVRCITNHQTAFQSQVIGAIDPHELEFEFLFPNGSTARAAAGLSSDGGALTATVNVGFNAQADAGFIRCGLK